MFCSKVRIDVFWEFAERFRVTMCGYGEFIIVVEVDSVELNKV